MKDLGKTIASGVALAIIGTGVGMLGHTIGSAIVGAVTPKKVEQEYVAPEKVQEYVNQVEPGYILPYNISIETEDLDKKNNLPETYAHYGGRDYKVMEDKDGNPVLILYVKEETPVTKSIEDYVPTPPDIAERLFVNMFERVQHREDE